jgi:hypothetical protein
VKIVATFLMITLVALLFMLPISTAIYDYRTDPYEQTFYDLNSVGASENISLFKPIYGADPNKCSFASDLASDNATPGVYYDATSHVIQVNGLTAGGTRDLTATYPVNALSSVAALDVFLNMVPWLWYLLLVAVLGVAIFSIWRRGEM